MRQAKITARVCPSWIDQTQACAQTALMASPPLSCVPLVAPKLAPPMVTAISNPPMLDGQGGITSAVQGFTKTLAPSTAAEPALPPVLRPEGRGGFKPAWRPPPAPNGLAPVATAPALPSRPPRPTGP